MNLADLFPDEDFRFRMGLRPVDPAAYFRPRDPTGRVLAERARWLAEDPGRYAWLDPEAQPLLEVFRHWLAKSESDSRNAEHLSSGGADGGAGPVSDGSGALDVRRSTLRPAKPDWGEAGLGVRRSDPSAPVGSQPVPLVEIGRQFEPDVLFLSPDPAGEFRLRGGVLCFPTGWALREKLGGTVEEIHGVVPGLNRAMGPALSQMLARLAPGEARGRSNWGLAATSELNLHPALARPNPAPPVTLDRLWLRVEEQMLAALPGVRGLVFALRIELVRLDEVVRDPSAAAGLARALRSMPAPLAAYKRLDTVREPLLALLGQ